MRNKTPAACALIFLMRVSISIGGEMSVETQRMRVGQPCLCQWTILHPPRIQHGITAAPARRIQQAAEEGARALF